MAPRCGRVTTATVGAAAAAAVVAVAATVTPPATAASPPIRHELCHGATPLTCTLSAASGSSVGGTVTLTPVHGGCGTSVSATVTGLPAGAVVAWHVHEYGDISAADGSAAGDHWSPRRLAAAHALPPSAGRDAGDLGTLPAANGDGVAKVQGVVTDVLRTDAARGRGLIIHERPDDGGGAPGARLAQCVLGVAAVGEAAPAASPEPVATPAPVVATPTPAETPEPVSTPAPVATPAPVPTPAPVATATPRAYRRRVDTY